MNNKVSARYRHTLCPVNLYRNGSVTYLYNKYILLPL